MHALAADPAVGDAAKGLVVVRELRSVEAGWVARARLSSSGEDIKPVWLARRRRIRDR